LSAWKPPRGISTANDPAIFTIDDEMTFPPFTPFNVSLLLFVLTLALPKIQVDILHGSTNSRVAHYRNASPSVCCTSPPDLIYSSPAMFQHLSALDMGAI